MNIVCGTVQQFDSIDSTCGRIARPWTFVIHFYRGPIAEAMYVGAALCDLSYSSHVHIGTVESCTRCTVAELQLRGAVTPSYSASKYCDAHHRC